MKETTKEKHFKKLVKLVTQGLKKDDYSLIKQAFELASKWQDVQMYEDESYIGIEDDVFYLND